MVQKKYNTEEEKKEAQRRRQAEYRQRKKDGDVVPYENRSNKKNNDEDHKKELNRIRQQRYRAKKKAEQEGSKVECKTVCKTVKEPVAKTQSNKITNYFKPISKTVEAEKPKKKAVETTEKSQDIQKKRVINLYKNMFKTKDEPKEFNFLNNVKKVDKAINKFYNTLNSRKNIYVGITSFLRDNEDIKDVDKEAKEHYYNMMMEIAKDINKEAGENKMSEKMKKNYIDWNTIKSFGKDIKDVKEKTIYSILTMIPPRRLTEYQNMKVSNKDVNTLNKGNYLQVVDNIPIHLVFNDYKTNKTYGKQVFSIPEDLKSVLADYIKRFNKKDGDYLFTVSGDDKPYKSFNKVINTVFKRAVKNGEQISTNVLRHSYITNFLSTQRTINEKKDLAFKMSNSIQEQEAYNYLE